MEKTLLKSIQDSFSGSSDFVVSNVKIKEKTVYYLYIDNMINRMQVNAGITEPLNRTKQIRDFNDLKSRIMISGVG